MSEAPGATTPTPAASATSRATCTPSRTSSTPSGARASRARKRSGPTCARSPTRRASAPTSPSASRSPAQPGTTTARSGPSRPHGEDYEARVVVAGVGGLHIPNVPEINGADTFEGPKFHSAQWDHNVDLQGQEGRRHRYGRQRDPVHPDHRPGSRPPDGLPAHPGLGAAQEGQAHARVAQEGVREGARRRSGPTATRSTGRSRRAPSASTATSRSCRWPRRS